jgi:hypothetical protein
LGAGNLNEIIPEVVDFYRCDTGASDLANSNTKQPEIVV